MRALLLAAILVALPSAAQSADATEPDGSQTTGGGYWSFTPSSSDHPRGELPEVDERTMAKARSGPRLRAGLGGGGAFWGGIGAGLGFDLGLQINDTFAVYVRGTFDTIFIMSMAHAALLAEVGSDRVSFATGVGAMTFNGGNSSWYGFVSVPVVLGITPFGRSESSMRRSGFHIWLEGAVRIELGRGSVGPYFGLKLGYVWR